MSDIDVRRIIEQVGRLEQIRSELLKQALSPEGAWIHEYEVPRTYLGSGNTEFYRYAKWQAHEAIFERKPRRRRCEEVGVDLGKTRHQHIGRVSSSTGLGMESEVADAYECWQRRLRLEEIEEGLRQIQAMLEKVIPDEDTMA